MYLKLERVSFDSYPLYYHIFSPPLNRMARSRKSGSSKKKRSTTRRRGTSRQRGGGLGHIYSFGAPIVPGLGNSAEVIPSSSCLAAARPGMISPPTTGLGLPGLSGGARGKRRRSGTKRRSQRGGRYSFDLTGSATFGGTPWGSGIPQVVRIPCEGSVPNPLNPPLQSGGVGGVDSARYIAPTAGYTNTASSWVGSTGAPSLLQTPYEARTMNPACLKTGGGRRKMSRRKGSRRKH